jgi:hypothetical protein
MPWYLRVESWVRHTDCVFCTVSLDKGRGVVTQFCVDFLDIPQWKADTIALTLDRESELQAWSMGNLVGVEVADDHGPDDNIVGIYVWDGGSGEGSHFWYVDSVPGSPSPVVDAEVSITYSDLGADGYFCLGVGDVPAAEVSTHGKYPYQIELELIEEFNSVFPGYTAELVDGAIWIRDVSLVDGVRFGSTTPNLQYWCNVHRPDIGVPSLTGWGMLALAVLLLASGARIAMKRRKAIRLRV